jgi:hypothetical protein
VGDDYVLPPAVKPTVTAGFKWQLAAASTALPQPPSASQNVPMNSAANVFEINITGSLM